MRLSEITKDGCFVVEKIESGSEGVGRLMALGLLPGMELRLTHEAPFGDPIAIQFNGCHMSLRIKDAAFIEVKKCV